MATTYKKSYGLMAFWLILLQAIAGIPQAFAQDALCAEVKIEIKQKLSLERQAFDAHMRITNGLDTSAIEQVKATLHFEDDRGNEVVATSDPNNTSASFFARIDTLGNIDAVDGSGRVAAKTAADIHWLIIPAQGTGGIEPGGKLYYIGATLEYTLNGQPSTVVVTPDYVTVKPQPLLDLDYFLAGDVYADDAFSPETEPPIPFTLGVRIKNVGGGAANKVTIESAQPKIVENLQGLLIDFKILESYVSDQPAGKTLLIDFGDIVGGSAKVGRWNMVTTLSGKFVEINATYTHADSLGGALTSLIRNINSYLLVHDIKVDLPGRDNIRDFLAYSGDVLRVFESDGMDSPVIDQSSKAALQASGGTHQLTFPATTGFAYVKLPDPFAGKRTPGALLRSDSKTLPPENVWLSQTRDENNNWQYFINFFDVNTTGRYNLTFSAGTTASIAGIVYYDVNNNGQQDEGEIGMGNIKVTLQGADNEGAGVSTSAYTTADGQYKFVSLKPGTYQLKIDSTDGYINGTRVAGSAGGVVSSETDDLVTDIILNAGAEATGYRFAKRKPAAPTAEADVSIAMTADKTTVKVNDEVTFTLIAGNRGQASAQAVQVSDLLPQGLTLITATASVGDYNAATGLWTIGTMAKDASATLTLKTKVEAITSTIVNRATIASTIADPNAGNNSAQVTLTKEAQTLSLTHVTPQEMRILVLASCFDGQGEDDTACSEARTTWAETYFADRGMTAHAVMTTDDFRQAFRSGLYNTYWINGGAAKLLAPLADEVRLAVLRGDTLILDGNHDTAADTFNAVTGAVPGAALNPAPTLTVDGAPITVSGKATPLTLNGAAERAHFDASQGTALASNTYGRGKALVAGFDLLATLQTPAHETAMRAFLAEILDSIMPVAPQSVVGNAYVPLLATVTAPETTGTMEVDVSIDLPAGTRFIDATPAPTSTSATQITWKLSMTSGQSKAIRLGIAAPLTVGNVLLAATATDGTTPVTADVNIGVIAIDSAFIQSVTSDAQGQVSAVASALQVTNTAYQAENYATAIESLITADRALVSPVTDNYRLKLAQWLQEAELLWQATPVIPVVPASITATDGTPQSTLVATAFAQTLQATVLDASNQPAPGAVVTFTLPATGASASFIGGSTSATATTGEDGIAHSPSLTANAIAGSYTATAAVTGVAATASFALTNQAAIPVATSITATSGTPQTVQVNAVFGQALQATVLDASNQPVPNTNVTFTLPGSGASATFAGGGITVTATTNVSGVATSPVLTANGTVGVYTANASVVGVATPANFALTNEAAPIVPAHISASGGTPQTATVNTAFVQALQATVTDASNQPVVGVVVTFTLPVSGASASFASGSTAMATTDSNGVATAPTLTANATAGAYTVSASVAGVAAPASFALTNEAAPVVPIAASIVAINGYVQVATVNAAFAQTLQAKVLDVNNQPVSGVAVTFTAPGSGAAALFANGQTSAIGITNAQGIATSPTLTANAAVGNYAITASADGVAQTATFARINSATGGVPTVATAMIAMAGTPQTTAVNTSFAQALQVMVLDASSRPVANLDVTFTLPVSGASARFTGDAAQVVVKTNAQGIATSPLMTANALSGNFTATAQAEELSASFNLTNRDSVPAPNRVIVVAGTPQTTVVNTAFAETLQVTVLDAHHQPVPGVRVTFTLPTNGASAAFTAAGHTVTVATDENGIAATSALTANGTAGDYQATATVEGIAQAAYFVLSNSVIPVIAGSTPNSIAAIQGTPQTTTVNTAFAEPLQAKVLDASNHPVANVVVTFTLPASDASAAFIGGGTTVLAITNASGVASAPVVIANAAVGSYTATATVEGVAATASFGLTNEATIVVPVAGSITAVSGSLQSAVVNTAFGEPLKVQVRDTGSAPMSGVAVTFALPGSGASALFANGRNTMTVLTDGNGIASTATLTANAVVGNYTATAKVEGVAATASFSLTNAVAPVIPTAGSITVSNGSLQSAVVNTAFAQPLEALVRDTHNMPIQGATVTFTLPDSGASATFVGSAFTATATTGADGIATSPMLMANTTVGSYAVSARVAGVATAASFALTNTAASGGTSHTFNGSTSTGTGTVTASVSGGGASCAFDLDKTKVAKPSGLMMQLLGKYLMPHGVFQFELVSCDPGSTVTVTTTWPNLKGMTGYMKYGPTPALPWASTWYVPNNLKINGNTVSYTITDGKLGDDDLSRNGIIRDPGGPVLMASQAEPIPALGDVGRYLLLILLMTVSGYQLCCRNGRKGRGR